MMRHDVVATLLWWTRFSELARKILATNGRFVVELHGVSSRCYADQLSSAHAPLTARDLDRILAWIAARFRFLTAGDLLETDRPGVVLTFDDGFANNFTTVLPLLEQHRAPAVFFVTTQHVYRPDDWLPATRRAALLSGHTPDSVPVDLAADLYNGLSVDQLRACARSGLVTIGSHTVSHPMLSGCPSEQLESELQDSKAFLEQICGRPVDLFAYPSGDCDSRVVQAARRSGYRAAFVEEPKILGMESLGMERFVIPRIGLYSSAPAYLSAKLSGLFRRPVRSIAPPGA